MVIYFFGITIFLITFFIRSWFKLKEKIIADDSWYHLCVANSIKQNRFRMIKETNFFLLGRCYDYPPLFHYLLAITPQKLYFYLNPLIDAFHSVMVYSFTYFLTQNIFLSIFASGIFILNPLCFYEMLAFVTPRYLGSLLSTITLVFAILYSITLNLIFFVISVFVFSALLLTHRMSTQITLFIYLLLGFSYDRAFLFILFLSFFFAVFLSRGHYFKILGAHIAAILSWKESIKFTLPSFSVQVFNLIKRVPFNVWNFLLLLFVFLIGVKILSEYFLLFSWFLLTFFLGIITAFRPFAIIGESSRNFEYTVFPSSILLSLIFSELNFKFQLFFFITFIFTFCFILKLKNYSYRKNKPMFLKYAKKVLEFLKKQKVKRLFCLPTSLSYAAAYFCGKKVLYFESYACKPFFNKRIIAYRGISPPLTLIKKLIKKYRIGLVLTYRFRLPFGKEVFRRYKYRVYKLS